MSRLPERRSSAIQTDPGSESGETGFTADAPASRAGKGMGLGWQVCILVWAAGFTGLFAYEVWGFLWKVGRGMFGVAP